MTTFYPFIKFIYFSFLQIFLEILQFVINFDSSSMKDLQKDFHFWNYVQNHILHLKVLKHH